MPETRSPSTRSARTRALVARQRAIARELRRTGHCTLNDWLEARSSAIHGHGVFARRDIPRGTDIIEYVGEKIGKREADRRGRVHAVYIFTLNARVDVDGAVGGNGAQLINHSCTPNASARVDDNRIWIRTRRRVRVGEELTYDYGFELENYADYPCRCGAARCRGYIVGAQYAAALQRRLRRAQAASAP